MRQKEIIEYLEKELGKAESVCYSCRPTKPTGACLACAQFGKVDTLKDAVFYIKNTRKKYV